MTIGQFYALDDEEQKHTFSELETFVNHLDELQETFDKIMSLISNSFTHELPDDLKSAKDYLNTANEILDKIIVLTEENVKDG